jgi:hypothetical protein
LISGACRKLFISTQKSTVFHTVHYLYYFLSDYWVFNRISIRKNPFHHLYTLRSRVIHILHHCKLFLHNNNDIYQINHVRLHQTVTSMTTISHNKKRTFLLHITKLYVSLWWSYFAFLYVLSETKYIVVFQHHYAFSRATFVR